MAATPARPLPELDVDVCLNWQARLACTNTPALARAMEDPSPESQPPGSQINPLLRQKMLSRAATFEGSNAPLSRRRSSMLSDTSDTRHSFRSSTDSLRTAGRHELASLDEPTHWISSPVLFAVLPAIGGLLYQNGGPILTDVLTLALASWFLHWCVRFPW